MTDQPKPPGPAGTQAEACARCRLGILRELEARHLRSAATEADPFVRDVLTKAARSLASDQRWLFVFIGFRALLSPFIGPPAACWMCQPGGAAS